MLYYWSLVQYQASHEEKNSGKKIKKPKPNNLSLIILCVWIYQCKQKGEEGLLRFYNYFESFSVTWNWLQDY